MRISRRKWHEEAEDSLTAAAMPQLFHDNDKAAGRIGIG